MQHFLELEDYDLHQYLENSKIMLDLPFPEYWNLINTFNFCKDHSLFMYKKFKSESLNSLIGGLRAAMLESCKIQHWIGNNELRAVVSCSLPLTWNN